MKLNKKEIQKISKYMFSAGSSFGLDLFLFTIFNYLLKNLTATSIILATVLARIISSFYNYFVNSRFVFKNHSKYSIIQYYILVIIQMILSAVSVNLISKVIMEVNVTIIKFFVDVIIFIINYIIQRNYIFKHNND